ncbi:MAG: division/cell wall cluster transcriptional repressor MraZ [Gemmataceae bacterium]|nr:division/cell wall cluster transcriptional repressor MraZ [Gemmataceae bacterium]
MLLTGTHPRTLDEKKRLTLPKKTREQLGEVKRLFVTPGPDQTLWLYDPRGLEELAAKLDQAPATDSEARVFRRLFFAQMEEVDIDNGHRILIPERLVQFAGLERDVVLLGVRDHLELWNARKWQQYRDEHERRFDAVAERAFRRD